MLAVLLLAVVSPDPCALPDAGSASEWKALAEAEFVLPERRSAEEAFGKLDALFASPDADLRDGVGYEATVAWIYKERKVDDAAITTKVKTALMAEPGLRSLEIDVDTRDNVVTLNGTVDSQEKKQRAMQIAQGVDGVKSVSDNLVVKSS